MTKQEINTLFKRYASQSIFAVDQLVNSAPKRREFIVDYYAYQLTEAFNMSRDHYTGHLLTLFTQGLKKNLPLSYILEEMELYRLEIIHALETEIGIENQLLLFDKSVYEEGYKPKIHAVFELLAKVSVIRHLHQVIKRDYPLALTDDLPEMPELFNVTDELFPPSELAKIKKIISIEATTATNKDRRLDYPEEMNAQEAAEYLNTTKKNLYQLTSAKKVPHYKRGRKLMFRKSELQNWGLEKVVSGDEQKMLSANHLLSKKKKR